MGKSSWIQRRRGRLEEMRSPTELYTTMAYSGARGIRDQQCAQEPKHLAEQRPPGSRRSKVNRYVIRFGAATELPLRAPAASKSSRFLSVTFFCSINADRRRPVWKPHSTLDSIAANMADRERLRPIRVTRTARTGQKTAQKEDSGCGRIHRSQFAK